MNSLKTMTGDALEGIIDYKVVDQQGEPIGSLHSLWSDPATGAVEFLGVKTGWLFGHNHVVPADQAELDEPNSAVRLPYSEAFIKAAPSISADSEISEAQEAEIYQYYRRQTPAAAPDPSLLEARTELGLPGSAAESGGDLLSGARAVSESTAAAAGERWRRVGRPAGEGGGESAKAPE